jgi:hypothetical protein
MPTILRVGPYRMFVYSADRMEPPHVHITREGKVAKFWLDPVRLQSNVHFARPEINRLQRLVCRYEQYLLREWHAFFEK